VVFVGLLTKSLEIVLRPAVTLLYEGREVRVGGALRVGAFVHCGHGPDGLHGVGGGGDVQLKSGLMVVNA